MFYLKEDVGTVPMESNCFQMGYKTLETDVIVVFPYSDNLKHTSGSSKVKRVLKLEEQPQFSCF